MAADVYVATESAVITTAAGPAYLQAGKTTVRSGHPLLAAYPQFFRLLVPDFDIPGKAEDAAAPEPPAPVASVRADQQGARIRTAPPAVTGKPSSTS
jgi:hypothetical protein